MKLLLLLGFILPISLFAQGDFRPGYIIKNNGDSVVGFVDYRSEKSNSESCYFRATQNQEVMRFSPTQISAYGFVSDKRYESRNPKGDSTASREAFMECIVRGPMSLYRLEGVFYIETGSLVKLPPKASKIVHTKAGTMHGTDNTYIGLLNHAIFACKLTANNIDYNERHITNLVQNYNRCKGREGTVYKGVKPFTRFSMYVSGGVDISKLTIDGLSNNVFKASSSPLIGLGVDISSPRLNDRLFLTLGAFYLKKEYVGYEEETITIHDAAIILSRFPS